MQITDAKRRGAINKVAEKNNNKFELIINGIKEYMQWQKLKIVWQELHLSLKIIAITGMILLLGGLIWGVAILINDEAEIIIPQPEPVIEEVEPEPEPEPEPVYVEPEYRAPLTGVASEAEINKRAYAIIIENSSSARPQSGMDHADIVYEVLAEGSITRFVTLYHSSFPESIGPIRSARAYMLDIAKDYDAVVVHAGGSPEALGRIAREGIPSLSEIASGSWFTRESFRKAPHNVYSTEQLLDKGLEHRKYNVEYSLPELSFYTERQLLEQEVEVLPKAEEAIRVAWAYSSTNRISYLYNQATEKYGRYINDLAHIDLTTEQQLTVTNLFVAKANHRVLDDVGRLEVGLRASGEGYAMQQGRALAVTWKYERGMMRFFDEHAQEIPWLPGNTWIHIVPNFVKIDLLDE